jgi:hypothetical protein
LLSGAAGLRVDGRRSPRRGRTRRRITPFGFSLRPATNSRRVLASLQPLDDPPDLDVLFDDLASAQSAHRSTDRVG